MNHTVCTLLVGLIIDGLIAAQQAAKIWPPPPWPLPPPKPPPIIVPPRPIPPRIVVPPRPQQPGQPMQLREMNVRARIVGLHVETTTEMTFYNPNPRLLEGELQFPLPDGAVITGYALDVNGQMVDGVVVKKEKARVAFETEVRAGIDPGIVEHTAGNVYRTRIYPLPPQGTRRIRLKYVAELPTDVNGDAACFLPMPIGETVPRLTVRVEVSQASVKPQIGGFGNLRFQSFNNLWVAETELRDAKPGDDIWIALPKLPTQVIALERTPGGEIYFAASLLTPVGRESPTTTKPPRRIGVAWDASGSRQGKHLQKEIAALKQLRTALHVLVFRDKPEVIRPLHNPESLADIAYDGGTDLAAAAEAIRNSDIDRWLLFTDGLDTLSDKLPDFGDKNVTAVVSQTVAHRELLRQVCANVVDLHRFDPALILAPVTRLVRVHGPGISDVEGIGATLEGRVNIHGKLTADTAELRFEYSDGQRSPPVRLSKKDATEGTLLASVWAAKRVNRLAVRPDDNEDELLALGRQFGIVSPVTSLIVLETVEQYVRHDIEPPASMPEWRRQWREQKAAVATQARQKRAAK
ncbi:MAG: VIT domain-containing protein, partial [Verrucomicrobiae bacterium]|nr:VIT domain-containing protein [Verrucomicrobiae bacterium]